MTLEHIKKPQMVVRLESVQQSKVRAVGLPTHAKTPATPAQLQRAKAKLEQDRGVLQRASEQASLDREVRAVSAEQARVQREKDQTIAQEQQARVQRLLETQANQQRFFSGFIKTPTQRKSFEHIKNSSVKASQVRAEYQAAIVPEIVQRLVDDQMTVTIQAARANQKPNDLQARADWFNTELPILRARHNHPNTQFSDTSSVFKPTDQQAFSLGSTYKLQRLSSGLTPKDAANALLNIQRKADRDIALKGLLTGVNPRQSDYSSIQRLVAAGEHDLEVQRQALLEDAGIQARAFQLAKGEANPTSANSGISEKIKAKLGAGNPLPENVRHQLEAGLNVNLEAVRVHTDSEADKLAKSVNAIAFTTGKDIFFSSGSFEPNTKTGYELIAHEVTHTVQQASGQVSPGIDTDSSLERDAQASGAKLASSFDPNFKFKNLENQAQPNSPLLSSQPPAHRAKIQAMQRSSLAVQRDPAKPAVKEEAKGTKLNLRGAAFKEGYTVKLRSSMETSSASNIVSEIPFGTTFLITEQITTWYKIKLDSGATGFVAGENISIAPEAKAEFYKIKPGDNAIDIASQHYKAVTGLDLRFYVGVLAKLNPKSIKMPDGIDWSKDSSVMAWKQANPMVGFFIWIPSQVYAASLKGSVNNGKLTDHPGAAAAEIGKGVVKKTIKDMGGDQVISTLEGIGQNVSLIWDNPGAFMENLQKSFTEGFGNFQAHFGEHLQTGVMQWLQSALGASFDIPKTADSAGLLSVGLQVVGLDYHKNLRPMLATSLPSGGLEALEGSGNVLQDVVKTGSLTPVIQMVQSREKAFESMLSGLPTTILNSLKDFAIKSIVTAGIKKMLTMLVPGGGLVQAAINIYNAITFFMDRAKQIGAFVQNLTSSFASIAKGDIKTAVKTIEAVLGSGLSLALGFLASAAGLTKIASSIKAALDKIQKPAQAILTKIKDWIVKMFSSLVKKVTPGTKPAAGDKSNSSAKPTDPDHDKKVKKGLDQIDVEETKIDDKDKDMKLTKAQAEQVAANVKRDNPIFSKILVHYEVAKNKIDYEWFASNGIRTSSRKPYSDELEPATNEGTVSNPFPLDWGKPASANYPTIYLGGKRNHLPLSQRFVSQSDLKNKVGEKDDQNVEIKAYTPQNQETLSGGEKIGLSPNYYLSVGSLIGPLAAKGITTPGGRKITDVLKRYGYNPSAENMDGDHIHEIQTGGSDMLENLWMLDSSINQAAGGKLDRSEIILKSGAKPKLFQLREYVEKTNRKIYFKIKSTL